MATGLTLTEAGAAEIEAAYQAGTVVTIVLAEIGDGGGAPVTGSHDELAAVTELVGKFGEVAFTSSQPDAGLISGEFLISYGDFPGNVLREVGLRSTTGTLIAYGGYPDSLIPSQDDLISREITVEIVLTLAHAQNVVLQVDPNVVFLTRETADGLYLSRGGGLSDLDDKPAARDALSVWSKTESDNRYISGIRLGAPTTFTMGSTLAEYSPGYVLTGGGNATTTAGSYIARPLQQNIAGIGWAVVGVE